LTNAGISSKWRSPCFFYLWQLQLARFYGRGKDVILKPDKGKAEMRGKVIECTKSFGEEEK